MRRYIILLYALIVSTYEPAVGPLSPASRAGNRVSTTRAGVTSRLSQIHGHTYQRDEQQVIINQLRVSVEKLLIPRDTQGYTWV